MSQDRFLIAPYSSGLQKDVKPWLIPDDAFDRLQNAYVFRSRVRKRFGSFLMNGLVSRDISQLHSRLRIKVGTTDVVGDLSGTVPGTIFKTGQLFSINEDIYTVYNSTPGVQPMLDALALTPTKTFDIGTGNFNFVGADTISDVYFYPAESVMGLLTYNIEQINNEELLAFDTQFAYEYISGGWERAGTAIWTGGDSEFFWGANWRGTVTNDMLFFVSNFSTSDPMRYWDGTSWADLTPAYNAAGDTILNSRIIINFKRRLILLNVRESVGDFPSRIRYTQVGSPLQADAWRDDITGKGGFLDAPTTEAIITAETVKDRLIVFFERSTYELVWMGNEINPFTWQKINSELGAESTFSRVPFDKISVGIGNVGIHACNGANVERIDDKIPDEVFKIQNKNEGLNRVYGIRDYTTEMIYWTFPIGGANNTYPNRVLVYNYKNQSWAFNDDSITCFGYYQNTTSATWQDVKLTWQEASGTWDSGFLKAQFRQVVAGNQQGFVFIVDPDTNRNAPALQITNIELIGSAVVLTIKSHNLKTNDRIAIEFAETNATPSNLNGNIYAVSVIDADTVKIIEPNFSAPYYGAGTATLVSRIDILSKQYNFYVQDGRNMVVDSVDFFVGKTANGEISTDFFPSASSLSMLSGAQASNAILGTNVLETTSLNTLENSQERFWRQIYFPIEGNSIQLKLFLSDSQLENTNIAWSDFELHAMLFSVTPSGKV